MKNNAFSHMFMVVLYLGILAGCAGQPQNYVILLDNPDGTTGAIVVSNDKGSQEINQPGMAVTIDNPDKPPGLPYVIDYQEVQKVFGETMSIAPQSPITFILYFTPGTNELTPESKQLIEQVLSTVNSRKFPTIGVTGHTDTVGKPDFNYSLSLKRATAIKELLVSSGINASSIKVASHGEGNLLVKTEDEVDEPKNRRVEIVVR